MKLSISVGQKVNAMCITQSMTPHSHAHMCQLDDDIEIASPISTRQGQIVESDNLESPIATPISLSINSSSDSSSSLEDVPIISLLKMMSKSDEDLFLFNKGYEIISQTTECLQGYIYKGQHIKTGETVCIKKISKELKQQNIAEINYDDDDGKVTFCVSEDIIKEADILKHLTVDNRPMGGYIPTFIDLFESEEDYYLIREYVDGMTLAKFIEISHKYIQDKRLNVSEYNKCIKFIIWQLITTLCSLHDVYHCMLYLFLNSRNCVKFVCVLYMYILQVVIWIYVQKISCCKMWNLWNKLMVRLVYHQILA